MCTTDDCWCDWDDASNGFKEGANVSPVVIKYSYRVKTGVGPWIDITVGPTNWEKKKMKWFDYPNPVPVPVEDFRVLIEKTNALTSGSVWALTELEFYATKAE